MRWFRKKSPSQPGSRQTPHQAQTITPQQSPPQPERPEPETPQPDVPKIDSQPRAGLQVGDLVTANHFRYYEPGRILSIPTSTSGGYHVDFGRFTLHLGADELTADDGTGIDTRTHPGWLQNLFCELLTEGAAYDQNGSKVDERWLTGKFWNFGHGIPVPVCEKAGLDRGTTYAQAARRLRRRN